MGSVRKPTLEQVPPPWRVTFFIIILVFISVTITVLKSFWDFVVSYYAGCNDFADMLYLSMQHVKPPFHLTNTPARYCPCSLMGPYKYDGGKGVRSHGLYGQPLSPNKWQMAGT